MKTISYLLEPDAHVYEWIWHRFKSELETRRAQDEAMNAAVRQIDSWSDTTKAR